MTRLVLASGSPQRRAIPSFSAVMVSGRPASSVNSSSAVTSVQAATVESSLSSPCASSVVVHGAELLPADASATKGLAMSSSAMPIA